jgi:outer membrane protein assembly factor BamC
MRFLYLTTILIFVNGCSYLPSLDKVLPDKRSEYKKSEALPALEVPPDLTAAEGGSAMAIPGEGKATLSEYKRQTTGEGAGTAPARTINQATGTTPVFAAPARDTNWVVVQGSPVEIWARLGRYLIDRGYQLDLNDAELGVMGTDWSQPLREDGFIYRDKYRIFAEPGTTPGAQVLYINNERQEQVNNSGVGQWIDQGSSRQAELQLAGELDVFLNGDRQVQQQWAPAVNTGSSRLPEIEIQSIGNDRQLLIIPEEFSYAWRRIETTLDSAGLVISSMNQNEGFYNITYYEAGKQAKKGWVSRLKFWQKEDVPAGTEFRLSLTGIGDKTEVIVLDNRGNWANSQQAADILALIRSHYNLSS